MNQGDLTAAVRTAMTVLGIDDSKECIDCELSEPEVASTLNDAVPRAELLIRCPTLACQPFMVLTVASVSANWSHQSAAKARLGTRPYRVVYMHM